MSEVELVEESCARSSARLEPSPGGVHRLPLLRIS